MTPVELASRELVLPKCCGTSRIGRELALIAYLGHVNYPSKSVPRYLSGHVHRPSMP